VDELEEFSNGFERTSEQESVVTTVIDQQHNAV
jgi:hypothetical protein